MKTLIAILMLMGLTTFARGQHSTIFHNSDGSSTTVTCGGGNCWSHDNGPSLGSMNRDAVAYCTKGLKMPKDEVIKHHRLSDACFDAFTQKVIDGPDESDCKHFDRNTRECK
jgi:hypothetical protein